MLEATLKLCIGLCMIALCKKLIQQGDLMPGQPQAFIAFFRLRKEKPIFCEPLFRNLTNRTVRKL